MGFEELECIARKEVAAALASLPDVIRRTAEECSIHFVEMESRLEIEPDLEDDLLGLFEGNARCDPAPGSLEEMPRIRLFLDNLWFDCDEDLPLFREEVRITLLHELGHYLGLDEDQVADLGLE